MLHSYYGAVSRKFTDTKEPDEETDEDFTYEAPWRQRNRFLPTIPFSYELRIFLCFHIFSFVFPAVIELPAKFLISVTCLSFLTDVVMLFS